MELGQELEAILPKPRRHPARMHTGDLWLEDVIRWADTSRRDWLNDPIAHRRGRVAAHDRLDRVMPSIQLLARGGGGYPQVVRGSLGIGQPDSQLAGRENIDRPSVERASECPGRAIGGCLSNTAPALENGADDDRSHGEPETPDPAAPAEAIARSYPFPR